MNTTFSLGLSLFCLLFIGCAAQSQSARPADLSVRLIYQMSEKQALDLVHSAFEATLAGIKIYKTKDPRRGFFAIEEIEQGDVRYARFMAKTYVYMVHVLPAQGKNPTGAIVNGYYFNATGSGDLESGPARSDKLKAHLQELFEKTGSGVSVTDTARGHLATQAEAPQKAVMIKNEKTTSDDVFEQLKKLKELLDQEVITEEEFSNKKKELLDRI